MTLLDDNKLEKKVYRFISTNKFHRNRLVLANVCVASIVLVLFFITFNFIFLLVVLLCIVYLLFLPTKAENVVFVVIDNNEVSIEENDNKKLNYAKWIAKIINYDNCIIISHVQGTLLFSGHAAIDKSKNKKEYQNFLDQAKMLKFRVQNKKRKLTF